MKTNAEICRPALLFFFFSAQQSIRPCYSFKFGSALLKTLSSMNSQECVEVKNVLHCSFSVFTFYLHFLSFCWRNSHYKLNCLSRARIQIWNDFQMFFSMTHTYLPKSKTDESIRCACRDWEGNGEEGRGGEGGVTLVIYSSTAAASSMTKQYVVRLVPERCHINHR